MDTWGEYPIFKDYIEFPGLVEKYGTYVKTVTSQELHGRESGIGALFKELRPRRNIQLQLHTTSPSITDSIELGSVHMTALGDIA